MEQMQVTKKAKEKYPSKTDSITVRYDSWDRDGTVYYSIAPSCKEELDFAKVHQCGLSVNSSLLREDFSQGIVDRIPDDLHIKTWEDSSIESKGAGISSPIMVGVDTRHLITLTTEDEVFFFVNGVEVGEAEYLVAVEGVAELEKKVLEGRANQAHEMLKDKVGMVIHPELWEDINIGMRTERGLSSSFVLVSLTDTGFECRLHNGCFTHVKEVVKLPLYYIKGVKASRNA